MVLCLCGLILPLSPNEAAGQKDNREKSKQGSVGIGPVAEIPVSTHDLGLIKTKGRIYQHDFLVLNAGGEALEISDVMVG